ncbi:transposase IS3/IS911 family protein (plasmid) [Paraburkholderia atlantica]|uniref:Transposase IS3/IS911 family protein n=2 Tax=Paraburkholderia atlantica TaxID=2654982 RepID=D5WNB4_PARAM|nr:transposase IS3/IS911 family protein [Paraburkholderia atlantica]
MGRHRTPYPAGFRAHMVELVRAGRRPEDLEKEFEPTAQTIYNWIAQADRDAGVRHDGLTTAERQELTKLRRENRQLKMERDILSQAAAWFARETGAVREASHHTCSDAQLLARIRTLHASSRGTYGAPRIHAQLAREGVHVGRKRVARLMRMAGLCGASRRRWPHTTRPRAGARPAPDLVRRHFSADAANVLWVADATYVSMHAQKQRPSPRGLSTGGQRRGREKRPAARPWTTRDSTSSGGSIAY